MQEDGTQKEDDVGATASTEENVQQEIPEINLTEIQQEEFQNGQNDNVEGEDTLQEKTNAETDQKETLQSDSTQNAENSSAEDAIKTTDSKSENRTGETVNNSDVENNASENAASVEPQAAGSVSITITDNIENAGTLNAQVTGDQPDGITLEWYKHAEGSNTWTRVERHKVTGNSYNVSEDGTALNVALDKGARCFYKVQVKDASGQLLAESAALQISY